MFCIFIQCVIGSDDVGIMVSIMGSPMVQVVEQKKGSDIGLRICNVQKVGDLLRAGNKSEIEIIEGEVCIILCII